MPNGMILERAWVALASLWNELSTENPDRSTVFMLGTSLGLASASFYAPFVRKNKTLEFRLNPLAYLPDGYDYKFSYGWESDLPRAGSDEALALPSPERPLPVWLAQRSFSLRLEKKITPFTLRNYSGADRPSEAGEKVDILGFTFVPIPAEAGGPSLYLQFDGAGPTWFPTPDGSKEYRLGDDWVVRTRINTDIGVMIPFRTGAIGGAGMGADLSVELLRLPEVGTPASSTTAPPSATADGGTSGGWTVDVGGVGFKAFASTSGGASGSGGENSGAAVDGATDIGVTAQISKFRVTLVPKSAVEKALVKERLSIALDVGITWSTLRGLVIDGASSMDVYWALKLSLGTAWAGMEVSYARLRIAAGSNASPTGGMNISGAVTFGIAIKLARATLLLDGIGANMQLQSKQPNGNLLKLAHVDGDLVRPAGVGLKLDWGPIQGGGFFTRDGDRYSGAIDLALGSKYSLRGVGFCEARPGGGTSTLLMAALEWPYVAPGWMITGFGVMFGLHRRGDGDAIRIALDDGRLAAALFARDPLGQSTAVVAALAAMFPVQDDVHVIGVMAKFVGMGGLFTGKLAFLVQFGSGGGAAGGTKLFLLATAVFAPPAPLDRALRIECAGVGEYDVSNHELQIRAKLRNSRLAGADLFGEVLIFCGDEDVSDTDTSHHFFLSIGGYHPRYFGGKGPGKARVDQRIAVVLARGNVIKLDMQFYLALAPQGFQCGASVSLRVRVAGFGLDGLVVFDGFWRSLCDFKIDVFGSVTLSIFGRTLAALELAGLIEGASPWHLSGHVKFTIVWWDYTRKFSEPLSNDSGTAALYDNAISLLRAAVRDPGNYDIRSPGGITLTKVLRSGVWATPERGLRMIQNVAPLDVPIDRIGRSEFSAPVTLHIERVAIGGLAQPTKMQTAEFAPALYYILDTEAALVAPAAEQLPAGFEAMDDAIEIGDGVVMANVYDEVIIDRQHRESMRPRTRVPPHLLDWMTRPTQPTPRPVSVRPPQYNSIDSGGVRTSTMTSFSAAWANGQGRVVRGEYS